MAGTKVVGATILNIVKYQTDRTSLKRVRAELKNIQKQVSKGVTSGGGPAAARATVAASRKTASAVIDSHVKAFEDISKLKSKQAAKNVQNNLNAMFGIGKKGKSARDSANTFKAAFSAQSDVVKKQNDEMNRYSKQMVGQQANIDKIRSDILKKRAIQEKRDRNAQRGSNDFSFEINRLNLQKGAAEKAGRAMEGLNRRYREGAIELSDFRQQSRHMLRTLRDQSKETMTLRERWKDLRKGIDGTGGGFGRGGLAAGIGIAGASAAGYFGFNAASNALSGSVDRTRGLQRAQTMGLSSEEVQALQLASLRNTGINLSYEKISDISKDVQDKVGQLSLGKWTQNKKDKTWSFGGGGELGDWVKIMTERGGYGRDEAVNTLKNARGPVEFGIILQNLSKQAKLTDQEFTALSEAINDFSYVTKAIGPDAENLLKAQRELANVGFLRTDAEKENLRQLADLSATYQTTKEILGDKFASSFVDGLKQAGIDTTNFTEKMAGTSTAMKELGEFVGQTSGAFLNFLNIIPGGEHKKLSESGIYYEDSWVGRFMKHLDSASDTFVGANSIPGINPNTVMSQNQVGATAQNPLSASAPVAMTHVQMTLQIDPNAGELTNAFSAHAQDVFSDNMETFSFGLSNLTANN